MIYVNGSPINVTLFPDNTSQVWHVKQLDIRDTNWVHVVWDFQSEGEFIQLAQLKDLLDAKSFGATLKINYLPYGRQDKLVSNVATFGLQTFSRLLNSLHFAEIVIVDPHSVAALNLINNSKARYPIDTLLKACQEVKPDIFCYPDKGAQSKYTLIYDYPSMAGHKVRNQETGGIVDYKVNAAFAKDKNILIVDDIADGGKTFTLLAEELISGGAKEVNLFVTHGIFSKGLKPLFESGIKRIYTKNGEAIEHQNNITYRRL